MTHRTKTDVWQLLADGDFVGFATTINGDSMVMLDYLAVKPTCRNGGIGTKALRLLQERYACQGFFVEIESPFEEVPDQTDRLRRRTFYQRCSLEPLKVMAVVFGVKMELLGRDCDLNFDRYQTFYRDNYSTFAAEHLVKTSHPDI